MSTEIILAIFLLAVLFIMTLAPVYRALRLMAKDLKMFASAMSHILMAFNMKLNLLNSEYGPETASGIDSWADSLSANDRANMAKALLHHASVRGEIVPSKDDTNIPTWSHDDSPVFTVVSSRNAS